MTPRLDMIGIVTTDMARSIGFYRRLGFEFPADAETQPHVEVVLPNGMRFGWDTDEVIRSFDPGWTASSGGRGVVPAILFDAPADVDAMYAQLVADGYKGHLEPWDAFWGQRYAVVLDPDGNTVDLFAALPASATS